MECRNLQPHFDQQDGVKINSKNFENKTRKLRIAHNKARSYVCVEDVSHLSVVIITFFSILHKSYDIITNIRVYY